MVTRAAGNCSTGSLDDQALGRGPARGCRRRWDDGGGHELGRVEGRLQEEGQAQDEDGNYTHQDEDEVEVEGEHHPARHAPRKHHLHKRPH